MIGCRTEIILNWWDKFTHYYIDNWKLSQRRSNDFYLQYILNIFSRPFVTSTSLQFLGTHNHHCIGKLLVWKHKIATFTIIQVQLTKAEVLKLGQNKSYRLSAINSNLVKYYFRLTEFIWKHPVKWNTIKAVLPFEFIETLLEHKLFTKCCPTSKNNSHFGDQNNQMIFHSFSCSDF